MSNRPDRNSDFDAKAKVEALIEEATR